MEATERISVKEAAEILGLPPQAVRVQMERGKLDIGIVLPATRGKGKHNQYLIFRNKLNKLIGREEPEEAQTPG